MAPAFSRLLVQLVLVCGSAVARAVVQAYKDTALRGGAASRVPHVLRRRMSVDEAGKILEVDVNSATEAEIQSRFQRLYEINAPTESFLGSPYIRKKVENAKVILGEHALRSRQQAQQRSSQQNTNSAKHAFSSSPFSARGYSATQLSFPLVPSLSLFFSEPNPSFSP